DVDLNVGGNANISSPYGSITLGSGGAGYGVSITAAGSVTLNADQGATISANITANGGDVDIYSESSEDSGVVSAGVVGKHAGFAGGGSPDAGYTSRGGTAPVAYIGGSGPRIGSAYLDSEPVNDIDYTSLDIEDSGSITLDAQAGAVNLTSTTLDSYGGPVSITAGTTVDLDDTGVYSYNGDVSIASSLETDIQDDSSIGANGDVSVHSGHTLTVDNSYIYATGSASLISDVGDVDVSGGDIEAYQGGASLTATLGAIDIENAGIYTYGGDLTISGANDVDLSGSGLFSFNNGISISSTGSTVEIANSYLYASGDISASSSDMLTVNTGHDFTAYDYNYSGPGYFDIYSGGNITLTGGTCASVVDTTMFAQGNLMISGQDGNVLIEDVDIETGTGNLCISANNTLTMDSGEAGIGIYIEAGDSVNISAGDEVEIDPVGSTGSSIYADSGDITITSTGGGVDVENVYLSAGGNVNISAEGSFSTDLFPSTPVDVYLSNDSIYAGYSDTVSLTSDYGDINVFNSTISGGSVNMQAGVVDDANQEVLLSDDNVYANNSIDISAPGAIIIEGNGSTDSLTASDGGVTIEASEGQLSISDMDINSREYSSIDLSGLGIIQASGNVNIGAQGGSVDIGTGGDLGMDNVAINIGGDISISGYTITASSGAVNITTGGSVDITSGGSFSASNSSISGDNIQISSSTITAATDVYIDNGNSESITDPGVFTLSQLNNLDVTEGSIINAQDGNVTLGTDGNVDVDTSVIEASGSVITRAGAELTGSINITAGGNVDVDYADLSASDGVSLTANNGYVSVLNSLDVTDQGLVDDYNLTLDDWSVSAGSYINIGAGNNLTVEASTITASGGDVTLRSGAAVPTGGPSAEYNLTIEDGSSIQAYDTISARANNGNNDIYNSSLTALNGNVDIYASQNVDIENSTITVTEPDIDLTPGSSMSGDSIDISNTGGNIMIGGGGSTKLINDTFNLGQNIHISDNSLTAGAGNVYIAAGLFDVQPGTVITGCTFNSSTGNVVIDTGSDITSEDGDLTSTVTIDAGNNITIGNSTISATPDGSNANISVSESGTTFSIQSVYGNIDLDAIEGNVVLTGSTFELGGDVNITGASVTATAGDIDLYAGQLSITAGGTIDMSGCTIDGGQINITAGSDVSATGSVNMTAETVNVADSLVAATGDVNITAAGAVNISSGSSVDTTVTGNNVTINAQDGVTVSGANINGSTQTGSLTINNASGQTTVNNSSQLQAFYVNINSDDGILIDGANGGGMTGNTLNANVGLGTVADDSDNGHTATIQNTDLSGFANVNVQAHTVNLNSDNFSSSGNYNFTSFYHGYYINNGSVAGYVNFNNDTLDHAAITVTGGSTDGTMNPGNNGGIGLGGTGAGIHIN
ncbi:MAG TPA: hypothetical protein VGN23_11445, partial [Verrucomicrobiae bacterium]